MGSGLGWWLVAMGGAAVVTATVSRRWVWQAGLLYLFAPAILLILWLGWAILLRGGDAGGGLGMGLFALALVGSVGAVPWILTCVLGFLLGLVPRRWLRPAAPVTADAGPWSDWRPVHLGVEGDGLAIGGIAVWGEPWRLAGLSAVTLPHPAHPQQSHSFYIYEVGAGAARVQFAAAELSNGVWGFYQPAIAPMREAEGVSADGTLRYVQRRIGPANIPRSTVILSDAATGAVHFDGRGADEAWVVPQDDGTLALNMLRRPFSVTFFIHPGTRRFRVAGEAGEGRPLDMLADAARASLGLPAEGAARPPVAWRSLVLIALGAAVAIAVASYATERFGSPRLPQPLTPLPGPPVVKG